MRTNPRAKNEFVPAVARAELEVRQQLVILIDSVYDAFKRSGRPDEEYVQVQWYESLLYKAVNQEPLLPVERLGALKVIRGYLQRLRDAYLIEAKSKKRRV